MSKPEQRDFFGPQRFTGAEKRKLLAKVLKAASELTILQKGLSTTEYAEINTLVHDIRHNAKAGRLGQSLADIRQRVTNLHDRIRMHQRPARGEEIIFEPNPNNSLQ